MNPVFAVDFMNHEEGDEEAKNQLFSENHSFWII